MNNLKFKYSLKISYKHCVCISICNGCLIFDTTSNQTIPFDGCIKSINLFSDGVSLEYSTTYAVFPGQAIEQQGIVAVPIKTLQILIIILEAIMNSLINIVLLLRRLAAIELSNLADYISGYMMYKGLLY